jgi:hypothetical protein
MKGTTMKKVYLLLTAIAMIAGTIALGRAYAANSVNGTFTRATNFSPSRTTGCVQSQGASGKRVQMDANLNIWGANVNIAPFGGCTRREGNHQDQLFTACFDGWSFLNSNSGNINLDADIFHDCFPHGGGKRSDFWMLAQ